MNMAADKKIMVKIHVDQPAYFKTRKLWKLHISLLI
jgi:hypothetical protein